MTVKTRPDPALTAELHVSPARHDDASPCLREDDAEHGLKSAGLTKRFVQENLSCSRAAATLRGLHFPAPLHGLAKLARCVRGRVLGVEVDISQGSTLFGVHKSRRADSGYDHLQIKNLTPSFDLAVKAVGS